MGDTLGVAKIADKNEALSKKILSVFEEANKVVLDKPKEIKLCLACIISRGHLLIEDKPGMGKTTLVKTLAKLLGLEQSRIQFTNDMLPADILGASIFNQKSQSFDFHKGPIFANFVLADEINRATPKTQSACLQAMEERQVTIDGNKYDMPDPFFIVATQNPLENYGTFPLPESQIDRFNMRIHLGLPSRQGERSIIAGEDRVAAVEALNPIMSGEELNIVISDAEKVHVSDVALDYIQDIIEKTRSFSEEISPRASRDLYKAARSYAYLESRDFVIPEDVQIVAAAVLNHRAGKHDIVKEVLQSVEVK